MSFYAIVLLFGFAGLAGVSLLVVITDGNRQRRFRVQSDQAIDLTGGQR